MAKRLFDTYEEQYYLAWNFTGHMDGDMRRHINDWMFRTAIFHYSNGTNRCAIEGCNASIDTLTLEHENFDRVELNTRLGIYSKAGGSNLARALVNNHFPDYANITVKCMFHNSQNKHKNNLPGKSSKYMNAVKAKAFMIYGYEVQPGMTWEHSSKDGSIHRLYLKVKYNSTSAMSGNEFSARMISEQIRGLPNWPDLIVQHFNDNHKSGKGSKGTVNYDLFWTEERYKPFRESLTTEQKERMLNEQKNLDRSRQYDLRPIDSVVWSA